MRIIRLLPPRPAPPHIDRGACLAATAATAAYLAAAAAAAHPLCHEVRRDRLARRRGLVSIRLPSRAPRDRARRAREPATARNRPFDDEPRSQR